MHSCSGVPILLSRLRGIKNKCNKAQNNSVSSLSNQLLLFVSLFPCPGPGLGWGERGTLGVECKEASLSGGNFELIWPRGVGSLHFVPSQVPHIPHFPAAPPLSTLTKSSRGVYASLWLARSVSTTSKAAGPGAVLCILPGFCPLILSLSVEASVLDGVVGPSWILSWSSCYWPTITLNLIVFLPFLIRDFLSLPLRYTWVCVHARTCWEWRWWNRTQKLLGPVFMHTAMMNSRF